MTSNMAVLRIKTLSIAILLLEQLMVIECRSCSWSKNSVVFVDSCPETKSEFEKRESIKNCGSMANQQNCTDPAKFKYHCLIDETEKFFIEVCVPLYNILLGYCAEYNTVGALVQQHSGLRCNDTKPPCPDLYQSTDAYIYKGCYEIVKRKRQTTTSDILIELSTEVNADGKKKNSTVETVQKINNRLVTAVIVAAVLFLLIGAVAIVLVLRYNVHRRIWRLRNDFCRRRAKDENQLEESYNMLDGKRDDKNSTLNDTSQMPLNENSEMSTVMIEDVENELPYRKSTLSPTSGYETHTWPDETSGSLLEEERYETQTWPDEESNSSLEEEDDEKQSCTDKSKDSICNIEDYAEEIEKAKTLKDTVTLKEKEMDANFERQKEETRNFLDSYEDVCKCFVKTRLVKKCQQSLRKNGIAILSGQQGSGKTLAAVFMMSKCRTYKSWTKIKITSWVDLLTLDLQKNTLVYIDNLFDGYMHMYSDELRKWWCSLCYFYFYFVSQTDIHLLITAKSDVMKEVSEQIKTEIGENAFCLKAELFPLSDEEKKQILESQFKLAEQLKRVQNPEIDSFFETIKDNSCAIGFPLRAHLYAFETDPVYKTKDIFTDPVSYVIRHFQREIEKDKDSSAKTLFLFLLFYTNPNNLKPSKRLDLRYDKDLREYLEDPKVVPENLLKEMGPLNFENLPTIAESLQYTILVKQSTMFEFKHQIYLDGASDYFLRKYPEVAVRYFPLDIIRPYAFSDASIRVWCDLIQRFKNELQENENNCCSEKEIEYRKIPEVLSCKIFDTVQFQSKFGKEFKEDSTLNWLFFTKEARFTFWAKRFGRQQLSETALNIAKEHYDFQFYQGLYGEYCDKGKKYDANPGSLIVLERLKEKVWKFKTGDGRSILHLVLCSDRSDYDAYSVLAKMLTDTSKHDVMLISDLLKCASEYLICSRILCLLELLRKQNESFAEQTPTDVSNIIAQLRICTDYDAHLELEFLVRICIVLANGEASAKKVYTDYNSVDERFRHVRKLLDGNETTQSRMTKIINDCIAECHTSSLPCPDTKRIPFTNRFTLELKQAIHDSVQVLSRQERLL